MKKTILMTLVMALTFLVNDASAQSFGSAAGVRLGVPLSITYKTFLNETNAIEVMGGTRSSGNGAFGYRWYQIGAAYQVHKPLDIADIEDLAWYFGGGASAYFWSFNEGFLNPGSNSSFGLQGYLGLSYTFENAPINLSIDWVPTYFINGFASGFGADGGSLGIRYIFGGGE